MQCDKPKVKGWGRPNQVNNTMEKVFEINPKKSLIEQTMMPSHLDPHKITNVFNANQIINQR
jgi:hypothetical protein